MREFRLGDITIFVGSVIIDDLESMIKRLRSQDENEWFVQPLRRGSIANKVHGRYIAYKSRILKGRKIRRASVLSVLLSSGVHQLSNAYTLLSKAGHAQIVGVYKKERPQLPRDEIESRPNDKEVAEVHGTSDRKELVEKAAITALTLY